MNHSKAMLVWVGQTAAKCCGAGASVSVRTFERAGVGGEAVGGRQPDAEEEVSIRRQRRDAREGRRARERDDRVPCGRLEGAAVVPLLHQHALDGDAPGLAGDGPRQGDGVVVSDLAAQAGGRIGLRKRLHNHADRDRRAQAVLVRRGQRQVDGVGRLRRRRAPVGLPEGRAGDEDPAAVAGPAVGQRVAVRVAAHAAQYHTGARVDRVGLSRGRDGRGLVDDRLDVGDGHRRLVGGAGRDLCRQGAEAELHAFPVVLDGIPGRRERERPHGLAALETHARRHARVVATGCPALVDRGEGMVTVRSGFLLSFTLTATLSPSATE